MMEEKKSVGRPRIEKPRSKVVQVRLTEEDYLGLEKLALRAGMTVSAFVRANIRTMVWK